MLSWAGRTAKRLAGGIVMIWVVVSFTFFLVHAMPGNPVQAKLMTLVHQGVPMAQAQVEVAAMYGYLPKEPVAVQYVSYMWKLLHLNLGQSITSTGTPVVSLLGAALPWTITMVLTGTVISFMFGVIAGVMAALLRDHWIGSAITLLSSVLHGIPQFLLAVLLALLFTTVWPIFPFGSPYSINLTPGFNLPFIGSLVWHGVLPVATYAISGFGGWALTMKSSVVSVLGDEFIIAARLRGISPAIRWQYVARNAILPLFTGLTMSLGFMFGGAVFVEDVFDYPGLGHLLLTAVGNLDYPTMDGAFALITAAVILSNILADLLYSVIDPRIRTGA